MKAFLHDFTPELMEFGDMCSWCTSAANRSKMKLRANNKSKEKEVSDSEWENFYVAPTTTTKPITTMTNIETEEGEETRSEWCNRMIDTNKALNAWGFMAWRAEVADAVLEETLANDASKKQF